MGGTNFGRKRASAELTGDRGSDDTLAKSGEGRQPLMLEKGTNGNNDLRGRLWSDYVAGIPHGKRN
jgi:hypothetical protein